MRRLLTVALVSLTALPALAGVSKVSSPEFAKGAAEVEYSGTRYSDSDRAHNNQQAHTYELEYGFTDRFMFGLEANSARTADEGHEFTAYGIEAQYALTKQGDWWLSSAIKGEYGKAVHRDDADEFEAKLLASRTYGPAKFTGNLSLERQLGNNREHGIGVDTALQAVYSLNEHFNPGLEWHADWGSMNNFATGDDNAHYVGPIARGELFEIGKNDLEYTVGYYWGSGSEAADHAARVQLEYGFAF